MNTAAFLTLLLLFINMYALAMKSSGLDKRKKISIVQDQRNHSKVQKTETSEQLAEEYSLENLIYRSMHDPSDQALKEAIKIKKVLIREMLRSYLSAEQPFNVAEFGTTKTLKSLQNDLRMASINKSLSDIVTIIKCSVPSINETTIFSRLAELIEESKIILS